MAAVAPSNGELRQRNAKSSANGSSEKTSPANPAADDDSSGGPISILDILRALAGIALVSTIASYAVTQGESLVWNVKRPWWTKYDEVSRYMAGPLLLTNDQLAAYDGSDPTKPILLALNRTIYDVSSSSKIYGVGGMYSALAAKDASRSYITTCFDPIEDLVPYFGGLEEVYVPLFLLKKPPKSELDAVPMGMLPGGRDAEDLIDSIHKKIGRKNIKGLREKAYENGKQRVRDQVKTWENMFEKKGYPVVGRVIGVDEEDPNKWRHLGFCKDSQKQRPDMATSLQEAMEAVGKGDQMQLNLGKLQANPDRFKKKKMKKSKAAKQAEEAGDKDREFRINMGLEEPDPEEEQVTAEEDLARKANVRIEDMLKGGKYYPKDGENKPQKKISEIIAEQGGDMDQIRDTIKKLKERQKAKGDVADSIWDEILEKEKAGDPIAMNEDPPKKVKAEASEEL